MSDAIQESFKQELGMEEIIRGYFTSIDALLRTAPDQNLDEILATIRIYEDAFRYRIHHCGSLLVLNDYHCLVFDQIRRRYRRYPLNTILVLIRQTICWISGQERTLQAIQDSRHKSVN